MDEEEKTPMLGIAAPSEEATKTEVGQQSDEQVGMDVTDGRQTWRSRFSTFLARYKGNNQNNDATELTNVTAHEPEEHTALLTTAAHGYGIVEPEPTEQSTASGRSRMRNFLSGLVGNSSTQLPSTPTPRALESAGSSNHYPSGRWDVVTYPHHSGPSTDSNDREPMHPLVALTLLGGICWWGTERGVLVWGS